MKIINEPGWIKYVSEGSGTPLDPAKSGKWMYFFTKKDQPAQICTKAIEDGLVMEAKHNDRPVGIICFYLNADDIAGHKAVITFMQENNLIKKTKTGKLFNINFKLDDQEDEPVPGTEIKLEKFVDLETGKWIYNA